MDWKSKMTPDEREEYERSGEQIAVAVRTRRRIYNRVRQRILREGGKPDVLDT